LSKEKWKLGFGTGLGQRPRRRTVDAGDLLALRQEIEAARRRFGLAATALVRSCYEAGRDGFWLHRYLVEQEVENLVVDSSSIEVDRRAKRAKTDRIDVEKLLNMLIRYHSGEETVWRIVHVPSVEAEDMRHLHRQLGTLKVDRTRHICRIKDLLFTQGLSIPIHVDFLDSLAAARLWDGSALPLGLCDRVEREYASMRHVEQQIKELEVERAQRIETSNHPSIEKVRQLMRLRAIGPNSAWLFVMEFFGWRQFRNRREVGGLSGLTPTPYQSGGESREQGISKAGNRPVRAMAIEIAWCWLRYQPDSELTRWFYKRFGNGGKRMRKIGIVALARKLLVALWRYLETGEIPAGAQLKP
jgi:transposase